MNNSKIVGMALAAKTVNDAENVQAAIEQAFGGRNQRPLGDTWGNLGLITGGGGSFDHKLIENVTNMQDAVVERAALARFGSLGLVPYQTPREASEDLFKGIDYQSTGDSVSVEFRESDPPTSQSKRLTVVFRDLGCGMTPSYVPRSIFGLGSSHKDDIAWQQGAFGLGGMTTFRNATAVILVTRRAPELLTQGQEDRICVAVLQWEQMTKKQTAFYLVDQPWDGNDSAMPFSVQASEYPEFKPGTHLALVSYGVEGYHRARLGDERSFDTVVNTRLFEPMTPVKFRNATDIGRNERVEFLRGLARRLEDNPGTRKTDEEVLPYNIGGTTYHLPIRYYVFSAQGEPGNRRTFVAKGHAVVFTSNGQVHHHWDPNQFKYRAPSVGKLSDRILVVVDTDELPIQVRTNLFTADRSDMVRSDPAIKLEDSVAAFLEGWEALRVINGELIRDALRRSQDTRATINVGKQIARAFKGLGFGLGVTNGGGGGSGGASSGPRGSGPIDLYNDPTTLEGPEQVTAESGKTKSVSFILNAVDSFSPARGQLEISCTHPEINDREITVGQLRRGRIRAFLVVPEGAAEGEFTFTATLAYWQRSTGGIGATMSWTSKLEVCADLARRPWTGAGREPGSKASVAGDIIPVFWQSHLDPDFSEWSASTAGAVQQMPAAAIAEAREEYKDLEALGDAEILTIVLNKDFTPLKKYLGGRVAGLSDQGMADSQDRYAVGVGTGMLVLEEGVLKLQRQVGGINSDAAEQTADLARRAVARGVLANMPQYDQLAKDTGVERPKHD